MTNVDKANYVYYGGIKFNKEDIASVKEQHYSRNDKNYEIKLKNGQTVIFDDQTCSDRRLTTRKTPFDPQISCFTENNTVCMFATDLSGVQIIGNPNKKDSIFIEGNNNLVTVDNDNFADEVRTANNLVIYDYNGNIESLPKDNNEVELGKNDSWINGKSIEFKKNESGDYSIKPHH